MKERDLSMTEIGDSLRFTQENHISLILIGYREKKPLTDWKGYQKRFPPEDTGKLLEANPDLVEFIEGDCNPKLQNFVTNSGVV